MLSAFLKENVNELFLSLYSRKGVNWNLLTSGHCCLGWCEVMMMMMVISGQFSLAADTRL